MVGENVRVQKDVVLVGDGPSRLLGYVDHLKNGQIVEHSTNKLSLVYILFKREKYHAHKRSVNF